MKVYRIVIGGLECLGRNLADIVATIGAVAGEIQIDGFTVSQGTGWHVQWGTETVTIVEAATAPDAAQRFAAILCKLGDQTCAYVTVNGAAGALWYPDGRQEAIGCTDSPKRTETAPERLLRTVRADTLKVKQRHCCNQIAGRPEEHSPLCRAADSPHGRTSDRDNSLPRKPAVY